jgi:hypothetical protein
MGLVVFLLPVLAAAIQSAWVFMTRGEQRAYQALLHPDNYNPVVSIVGIEVAITAGSILPLFRSPVLQVLVAALLLVAFAYYAFSINHLVIR